MPLRPAGARKDDNMSGLFGKVGAQAIGANVRTQEYQPHLVVEIRDRTLTIVGLAAELRRKLCAYKDAVQGTPSPAPTAEQARKEQGRDEFIGGLYSEIITNQGVAQETLEVATRIIDELLA